MSAPDQILNPRVRIGLSLLHAGRAIGKWRLAASGQIATGLRMERPLYSSGSCGRVAVSRHTRGVLQPWVRRRMQLGAEPATMGCRALRGCGSGRARGKAKGEVRGFA